jgi:hypothetical protein
MTAMTIVHLDLSQRSLLIFLIVVTNTTTIGSSITILIATFVFYDHKVLYIYIHITLKHKS